MLRGPLLILLSCSVGTVVYCSDCTVKEHELMQERFSSCRSNYSNRYHSRGSGGSVCSLLDGVLTVCSKEWTRCHNSVEIASLKEMHIEAFIRRWAQHPNLERCNAVKKFRASLRMQVEEEVKECDEEESTQARSKFSTCTHGFSSEVYTHIIELQEPVSPGKIINILCQGLHNISSQCRTHLEACNAPDDVKQLTTAHLKTMKDFFERLVEDRIPKNSLDSCDHRVKQTPILDSLSSTETINPGDLQMFTDATSTTMPPTEEPVRTTTTILTQPPVTEPTTQPPGTEPTTQSPPTTTMEVVTDAPEKVTLEDDFPMVTGSSGDKDDDGYGAIERFLRTEDPAVTDRTKAAGRVAVGGDADKKTGGGSTTDNGGSSAANTLVPTILLLILASRFI